MSRFLRYFSTFVILSLLLHLGVILYFGIRATPRATPAQEPFYVDLRDPLQRPRELDLPETEDTPRPTPAKRLGPSDHVAEEETAPKGRDSRDATPAATPAPASPAPPRPATPPAPRTPPTETAGTLPAPRRLPTAAELFAASQRAASKVAGLDPELQRKLRDDVAEGNAIWLDTEKDLLGSFYKRFRDAVVDAWVYPRAAIEAGQAGVCLYKIVINRAGVLVDEPQLLQSSGSAILDQAAADAVRDASPRFGFLPKAYPEETLTILAFFEYRLGGRPIIYGQRY